MLVSYLQKCFNPKQVAVCGIKTFRIKNRSPHEPVRRANSSRDFSSLHESNCCCERVDKTQVDTIITTMWSVMVQLVRTIPNTNKTFQFSLAAKTEHERYDSWVPIKFILSYRTGRADLRLPYTYTVSFATIFQCHRFFFYYKQELWCLLNEPSHTVQELWRTLVHDNHYFKSSQSVMTAAQQSAPSHLFHSSWLSVSSCYEPFSILFSLSSSPSSSSSLSSSSSSSSQSLYW